MRRNLWISAALLAAVGTHAVRGADTASPAPVSGTDRYRTALLAPDTKPVARDESARRLASGSTAADVAAVRDGLVAGMVPLAQIAAARAIAMTDTRDPTWVPSLIALLGSNRTVSDPAIAALGVYAGTRSSDAASDGLRRFATGGAPPQARAPAVRALGRFPDKGTADALVRAIVTPNPTIQSAAADALIEMTGEADRGTSPAQWQAWWAGHQGDTSLAFRSYLLDVRVAAAGPTRARQEQLNAENLAFDQMNYEARPPADRARVLASYLDARSAPIRALGAKLASGEVTNRLILDPALPRLRDLIADEDPDVRLKAVRAVQAAFDQQADPALVAQLGRERVPEVQKQLFQAVGKLQALEAAPVLVSLLGDGRPDVATAAARTLGEGDPDNGIIGMGRPLRAQRPAVADQACVEIRRALASRAAPPFDAFRAECAKALAVLGDPKAFDTYRGLLNAQPPEPWPVRAAALTGLGMLGDTRADAIVSASLDDRDNRVVLAAAKAMRTVGKMSEIQQLYNYANLPQEPDPSIREAAWAALSHLLEGGSVELLSNWVTRFDNDPARRLVVQQEYGRALLKAGQANDVAANNQGIADTLVEMKRYDDAIAPLQAAIDYYQSAQVPGGAGKLENLVGQMLKVQLLARQWPAAADFAGREIRAFQKYQQIAGVAFEEAAESLKSDRDRDGLNALIAAATSIKDPPLENRFIVFLNQIRNELSAMPPPR